MVLTLDSVYKKVLSGANKEQSAMYPPHIFQEHFNITTNWILDEVAKLYPNNYGVVDIAMPFITRKVLPLVDGAIRIPADYRNLLGVAVNVTDDFKNECKNGRVFKNDPLAKSSAKLKLERVEGDCVSWDITVVGSDEWGGITTSSYKRPKNYKRAIGCVFESKEIKICPNIGRAEIRYIRRPEEYVYGYKQNPDGTMVFDKTTSVESIWDTTTMQYFMKGMNFLYSLYCRDTEMRDWNVELKQIGLY